MALSSFAPTGDDRAGRRGAGRIQAGSTANRPSSQFEMAAARDSDFHSIGSHTNSFVRDFAQVVGNIFDAVGATGNFCNERVKHGVLSRQLPSR